MKVTALTKSLLRAYRRFKADHNQRDAHRVSRYAVSACRRIAKRKVTL